MPARQESQICRQAQSFPGFPGLSAIGVRLDPLQESAGQVRDHVGLFVEGEVARVEDVHLGVCELEPGSPQGLRPARCRRRS
jgi:hypothetical protein